MSTDGGALFLRQIERRTWVIDAMVGAVHDRRHRSYVEHRRSDLVRQRVYHIACGCPEGLASNALRSDPAMKTSCGRLPFSQGALRSQSTMSRLENAVSRSDIFRISHSLVDVFLDSFKRRPKRINA